MIERLAILQVFFVFTNSLKTILGFVHLRSCIFRKNDLHYTFHLMLKIKYQKTKN